MRKSAFIGARIPEDLKSAIEQYVDKTRKPEHSDISKVIWSALEEFRERHIKAKKRPAHRGG